MRVYDDLGALSDAAAEYIAAYARRCVEERGAFTWLLCGGSSPVPTYRLLAGNPYGREEFWLKTHVYWGDERCVPPSSEQSNYHFARVNMLDIVAVPDSQIHRMRGEAADRDGAAGEYASILPQKPDLVLLGMGPEGHTASLFPGSAALRETSRRVTAVEGPDYVEPRWRLTITPAVIHAARKVLQLVAGQEKAEAMEKVFAPEGDFAKTPARLVRDATWFVDRAAAERVLKMNVGEVQQVRTR